MLAVITSTEIGTDIRTTTKLMSQEPASTPAAGSKKGQKRPAVEEHVCRWVGCDENYFPTLSTLVSHVSQKHLTQSNIITPHAPVKYSCQWEGCSRFDVEQPSRFALISHCRTHTGEKPYFCPIPECEKHFTRSDALAKHVKGVHDLHQHRDAIALLKYRVEKGKAENPIDDDLYRLTDEKYTELINKDYKLRTPWWFSKKFVDVLSSETHTLQSLYEQPLDDRPLELAATRYSRFLETDDDEIISSYDVEKQPALEPLQYETDQIHASHAEADHDYKAARPSAKATYDELMSVYATGMKLNKLLSTQLAEATKEKRRLWAMTQILLDANVEIGLQDKGPMEKDEVDEAILGDGIENGV